MEFSQMSGFISVLVVSSFFFAMSSFFGHDDGNVDSGDSGSTHGENGPSILSLRNFFLFGIGFGAAGSVATDMGYSLMWSSVAGFSFGVVVAFVGWLFYRTIGRQQATSNTNTRTLVGKKATVSTFIPSGRVGQVAAQDQYGNRMYLDARSSDGTDLNEGEVVTIIDAVGNSATVAKS